MDWRKVIIYTTTEGIEAVSALLLEAGINGFCVEDSNDFKEFLESATPNWDYVDESLEYLNDCETNISFYLADNEQGKSQYDEIAAALVKLKVFDKANEYGRLTTEVECVNEDDWANNWKQYFKPLKVGEKLLIKPTWESLDGIELEDRTILEIDPSASFGTGTHYTTKLCLELLEGEIKGGETVLDMGCGSGILGIAAMLLGAKCVTSVDIDENSVRIAGENFAQNKISKEDLKFFCGNVLSDEKLGNDISSEKYDIVTANIVADVIIAMGSLLKKCVKDEGRLILSGIIDERMEDVEKMISEQGMHIEKRAFDGGWAAYCVKK